MVQGQNRQNPTNLRTFISKALVFNVFTLLKKW